MKRYVETFALVGVIGAISFLIPVIGDGEADLSKHLFLFNAVFDVMFVSGILWIVHRVSLALSGIARRGMPQPRRNAGK